MDAIFVLGYTLKDDGSIPSILRERLISAFELAKNGEYKIFVSGGNPKDRPNLNQAKAMQKWITENHSEITNIELDEKSNSTAEQILYIYDLIIKKQINSVIIIGTEKGFDERIKLIAGNIFSQDFQYEVIGAKLPEDITDNEKWQFIEGEKLRIEVLRKVLAKLPEGTDKVEALRVIVEKERNGTVDVNAEFGYLSSTVEMK